MCFHSTTRVQIWTFLFFWIFKVIVMFVCSPLKQPVQKHQLKAGLESPAHVGQVFVSMKPRSSVSYVQIPFPAPSCLIVFFPRHFGSRLFALNRLSTILCADFKQFPFSSQLHFIVWVNEFVLQRLLRSLAVMRWTRRVGNVCSSCVWFQLLLFTLMYIIKHTFMTLQCVYKDAVRSHLI